MSVALYKPLNLHGNEFSGGEQHTAGDPQAAARLNTKINRGDTHETPCPNVDIPQLLTVFSLL